MALDFCRNRPIIEPYGDDEVLAFILIITAAWFENFENPAYFPPADWQIVNGDGLDAVWFKYPCQAHSGQYAAICYYDTAYSGLAHTNLDYLITPRLLPAGSDTLIRFWTINTSSAVCTLDLLVGIGTVPSLADFIPVRQYFIADTAWTEQVASLAGYSGTPVYAAFKARRIPLLNALGLDDITLPDRAYQPFVCKGRLRTKGMPSQKYLLVWGTHYEMGFSQGYLLAPEIMSVYINAWIGSTPYHAIAPADYENVFLPWFRLKYYTPVKFQEEAHGIIDGITAKGVSLYHPALGRNLTAEDMLTFTGGGDIPPTFCSSLSGWGASTAADDTLQAGLVIGRNVDGRTGLYTTLGNGSLIIAYASAAAGEQKFFNVSIAGVFGAYSCLNENGVGICQNTGNHPDTNVIPPNSLLGDFLSSRLAVEMIDPDGNGVNDIYDLDSMKVSNEHFRSNDCHLYSPYDAAHPVPGAILEINHRADTLRYSGHNYIAPPINSAWNLCVTNHDRLLYPPVSCPRYQIVADSLNADFRLSTARVMAIANSVGIGYDPGSSHCTYHSLVLRPNIAVAAPDLACIGVSYARRYRAAHTAGKLWYSWNELFDGIAGTIESLTRPLTPELKTSIVFGPIRLPHRRCRLFDICGRERQPAAAGPGIYFVADGRAIIQKIIRAR